MERSSAEILHVGANFADPHATAFARPDCFAFKEVSGLWRVERNHAIRANPAQAANGQDPDRSILPFTNRARLIMGQTISNSEALDRRGLDSKQALIGAGPKVAFRVLFQTTHARRQTILRNNHLPDTSCTPKQAMRSERPEVSIAVTVKQSYPVGFAVDDSF